MKSMTGRAWLLLPCCLLLVQCGAVQGLSHLARSKVNAKKQKQPPQAPDPAKRGWGLMMSDEEFANFKTNAASNATGNSSAGESGGAAPPSGEGGAFDFSGMLPGQAGAATQVSWQRSATLAASKSRSTGLPLLLYATHSGSQPCHDIESTLMMAPAFRALMQEKVIPLLVDYSDQDTSRSTMYRELKDRFNVRGYPTLIMTQPDGVEISRLTGYKKEYEKRYLESLQSAVGRAEKLTAERRAKLEKDQNYRIWKNKDGKPVFARLAALDANMGTFTGEWGETFKTFLTRLSEEDQAWIAERRR
jgi:hypothetical protein